MKSRKRKLARDVFDAFATHSSFVYDVTDADYCAKKMAGSTDDRVFENFKRRF